MEIGYRETIKIKFIKFALNAQSVKLTCSTKKQHYQFAGEHDFDIKRKVFFVLWFIVFAIVCFVFHLFFAMKIFQR